MRFIFSSPFAGGFILLVLIYLIEYYTGVSSSVGYVLTVLFTLWFSWSNRYISLLGIFATLLIVVGFFTIENSTELAIAINRGLSVITIWLAVIFANRYRLLFEDEAVQKRQLQALFENATEGMIFTNSQGEIVRANPAAEKMFGYGSRELSGKKIEVLVPDKYINDHVCQRERLLRNPEIKPKGYGRELIARHKSGREFQSEISLSYFHDRKQVFYIAFVVDISRRKKQEELIAANVESIKRLNSALDAKVRQRTSELEIALHELESANLELTREIAERKGIQARLVKSQQLYTAIARNFPEGVIGVVDKQMRYVVADGQELDKIGFSGENPIGNGLFSSRNVELTNHAERLIKNVFRGERVSFDVEVRDNIYNLLSVPLPDVQGRINEILVVMKNITASMVAQRKLERAIEKEKELSTLKSRFVTMASHEFRTPLSTMLSSVFLLENYTGEKYELQKKTHLERIRRSIQTLTELINDFLSIGKLEDGQIKAVYSEVEITGFMKESVAELNSIKKPGQQIDLELSGSETTVMIDRQMLTHILRNLVSNAVKYSPAESRIRLGITVANGELKIAVEDQGMGIPEQDQPEIFKRFYRAENVTNIQGTGLGLNIVKKYLKQLNGTIGFESKVNEGTTFTVQIPVAIVAAESIRQFTH